MNWEDFFKVNFAKVLGRKALAGGIEDYFCSLKSGTYDIIDDLVSKMVVEIPQGNLRLRITDAVKVLAYDSFIRQHFPSSKELSKNRATRCCDFILANDQSLNLCELTSTYKNDDTDLDKEDKRTHISKNDKCRKQLLHTARALYLVSDFEKFIEKKSPRLKAVQAIRYDYDRKSLNPIKQARDAFNRPLKETFVQLPDADLESLGFEFWRIVYPKELMI